MKQEWEKVKEKWASLAVREKQAVVLGGLLLALFILYQGIWSPILNSINTMRQQIVTNQKTLLWMQSVDKTLQKLSGQSIANVKPVSLVVLLGEVQDKVKQAGLDNTLSQLKQVANESIAMHFEKVDFDKLMVFLTAFIKTHSVSISQMSAVATDTPGVVNVDMQMKQG